MVTKKDIQQHKNLKNYFKMEQTQQQMSMMQEATMQQQQIIQLDLSIMQMKMSLFVLAKDINKDLPQDSDSDVIEMYYFMRQEVMGIPMPQIEEGKPQEEVK